MNTERDQHSCIYLVFIRLVFILRYSRSEEEHEFNQTTTKRHSGYWLNPDGSGP